MLCIQMAVVRVPVIDDVSQRGHVGAEGSGGYLSQLSSCPRYQLKAAGRGLGGGTGSSLESVGSSASFSEPSPGMFHSVPFHFCDILEETECE